MGQLQIRSTLTPQPFLVNKRSVVIGRDKRTSDLLIDHQSVSRNHCEIYYQNNRYFVRDLGSSLGTFINNKEIKAVPYEIRANDILRVGPVEFTLGLDQLQSLQGNKQFRAVLFIIILIVVVPMIFSQKKQSVQNKNQATSANREFREAASVLPSSELVKSASALSHKSERQKLADDHFMMGMREFRVQNYWRALLEFESALQIYSNHEQAKFYKAQTEAEITKAGNEEVRIAKEMVQLHRYRTAQARLERARELLDLRKELKENKDLIKQIDQILNDLEKAE